jgi:hypothetical protein
MKRQTHRLLKWFLQALSVVFVWNLACLAFAGSQPVYQQGLLLEENVEFPCSHECGPFEITYFSFCVQSGEKVLLARLFDTRFNYDPNKIRPLVGKAIQFRSDDKSLWIVRPDGKEFHVRQDYSNGYFMNDQCVAELHRHLLKDKSSLPSRPKDVEPDAVYVPLNGRIGYWTKCFLAADRAIVCFARGPKGEEFSHVYQALPEILTNSDLVVDPLRTNYDTIVLAKGETLVRKYD